MKNTSKNELRKLTDGMTAEDMKDLINELLNQLGQMDVAAESCNDLVAKKQIALTVLTVGQRQKTE